MPARTISGRKIGNEESHGEALKGGSGDLVQGCKLLEQKSGKQVNASETLSTASSRSALTHTMGEQEENMKNGEGLRSAEDAPESELVPAAATVVAAKKKKKKKAKKKEAGESANAANVTTNANGKATRGDVNADTKPVGLCIARNKHWRYISSYHVRESSSRS